MEWIKCEYKLPELGINIWREENRSDWLLCCTIHGEVLLSLCYYDYNTNQWYDNINPRPETRIVYWMPLPSKPPIN